MIPIKEGLSIVGKFCKKNAPTILSIAAGLGLAATEIISIRAGIRMAGDITDVQFEHLGEDVPKKEMAKIIVKNAAAPTAVAGVTLAMIISSNIISIRRAKAMAASYALLSESAEVFRRKCVEQIGDQKLDKVHAEIAKDEYDRTKVDEQDRAQAKNLGNGTYWCLDNLTKQSFLADANYILSRKAELDRRCLQGEDYISVGEWCYYLGIDEPGEPFNRFVWPASMGVPLVTPLPCITSNSGEPAYHLQYHTPPMTEEEADIYNMNHACDTY